MIRCCTCDIPFCDGIECYLVDPAPKPIEEVSAPRPAYVLPSPEYAAWCAEVDSKRMTVTHSDPLLEKRDRRFG